MACNSNQAAIQDLSFINDLVQSIAWGEASIKGKYNRYILCMYACMHVPVCGVMHF